MGYLTILWGPDWGSRIYADGRIALSHLKYEELCQKQRAGLFVNRTLVERRISGLLIACL